MLGLIRSVLTSAVLMLIVVTCRPILAQEGGVDWSGSSAAKRPRPSAEQIAEILSDPVRFAASSDPADTTGLIVALETVASLDPSVPVPLSAVLFAVQAAMYPRPFNPIDQAAVHALANRFPDLFKIMLSAAAADPDSRTPALSYLKMALTAPQFASNVAKDLLARAGYTISEGSSSATPPLPLNHGEAATLDFLANSVQLSGSALTASLSIFAEYHGTLGKSAIKDGPDDETLKLIGTLLAGANSPAVGDLFAKDGTVVAVRSAVEALELAAKYEKTSSQSTSSTVSPVYTIVAAALTGAPNAEVKAIAKAAVQTSGSEVPEDVMVEFENASRDSCPLPVVIGRCVTPTEYSSRISMDNPCKTSI